MLHGGVRGVLKRGSTGVETSSCMGVITEDAGTHALPRE